MVSSLVPYRRAGAKPLNANLCHGARCSSRSPSVVNFGSMSSDSVRTRIQLRIAAAKESRDSRYCSGNANTKIVLLPSVVVSSGVSLSKLVP